VKYRLEAACVTAEADAEMLVPHSLDLTSLKTNPRLRRNSLEFSLKGA